MANSTTATVNPCDVIVDTGRKQDPGCTRIILVDVPGVPMSISFRPYAFPIQKSTLLGAVFNKLKANLDGLATVKVLSRQAGGLSYDIISDSVRPSDVLEVGPVSQFNAVAGLAKDYSKATFVVVPMGYILAPSRLLQDLIAFHEQANVNSTYIVSFPIDVSPIIITASLVHEINVLGLPGFPESIGGAVELYRRAASMSKSEICGSISCCFDARMHYERKRADIPKRVPLRSKGDCELLVRCLGLQSSDGDHAGLLASYKRVALSESAFRTAEARRGLSEFVRLPRLNVTRPKTVLFASGPAGFSGGEQSLCHLISFLKKDLYRSHALVSLSGTFADKVAAAGAVVYRPECDVSYVSPENLTYCLKLIEMVKPDIIHANAYVGSALTIAAHLQAVPFVQHVRVADVGLFEQQLADAHAIIAVSRFVRDELLGLDVDEAKIHVVYNGVDTNSFRPNKSLRLSVRASLELNDDDFVIIMVGRYTRSKRHDLVVRALSDLQKSISKVRLIIVGDVFDGSGWYEYVRSIGLQMDVIDRVLFLPFMEDIRGVLAASDVLVLPSEREALSRVVLEGMAMGLPVIVSKSGGFPEIIIDGATGYSVEENDWSGIVDAVVRVWKSPQEARRIGLAAREFVSQRFSAQSAADGTIAVWEGVWRGVCATD